MQAYEMWKTFDVSERVDTLFSRARRDVTERHNEEVIQNREMLRALSEALGQETFYKSLTEIFKRVCKVVAKSKTIKRYPIQIKVAQTP